jgi:hypothetical protein
MRVICFTLGRNRTPNSNKNIFEIKIGDMNTGKNDENWTCTRGSSQHLYATLFKCAC